MKFKKLVGYFERLDLTTKRLEMTDILAELFNDLEDKEKIAEIIYLCQGQLLASFKNVEFGISEKIIHKAIVEACTLNPEKVEALFSKLGDYGEVAEQLCKKHKKMLEISQVYDKLTELGSFSGDGAVGKKVEFLSRLLDDVSQTEAKYVIRIILGRLRLGVGDPTVLDALSLAFCGDKKLRVPLERAYNLCSDLGLVARILFTKGMNTIRNFKIILGNPIRVALAARLSTPAEIIEKIGTCAVEAKYDGFRCQVHKSGDTIAIFSRNQENTTHMFPDICDGTIKQIKEKNVIFEGEALAYDPKTGECLSFQTTVQRKRKYGIEEMRAKFPLKVFVFDMLYNGDDLTQFSYEKRRKVMASIIKKGKVLEISPVEVVDNPQRMTDIFEDVLAEGREGIVAKRLDGKYKAGGRNFNWIKLKASYSGALNDTVDCVIVGYFFGKGARASFGIGSLLVCVYDTISSRFKTIAKLGTGLSENDLKQFKEKLDLIKTTSKPKLVDSDIQPDVWVDPKHVFDVQADAISRSPVHTCGRKELNGTGFALRFPRLVGFVRLDKNAKDATSVDEIIKMFGLQGRKK